MILYCNYKLEYIIKLFVCLCRLFLCKKIRTQKIKPEMKYILPNSDTFRENNKANKPTDTHIDLHKNNMLSPKNSIDKYNVVTRHRTISQISKQTNNNGSYSTHN